MSPRPPSSTTTATHVPVTMTAAIAIGNAIRRRSRILLPAPSLPPPNAPLSIVRSGHSSRVSLEVGVGPVTADDRAKHLWIETDSVAEAGSESSSMAIRSNQWRNSLPPAGRE